MSYPEAIEDDEQGISLIDQLGTEKTLLERGKLNKAKLGVIMDSSDIPDTFPAIFFFKSIGDMFDLEWANSMVESYLDLTVGVRGRGRSDMLKGESVKRGIGVEAEPRVASPSFFERHITNRKKAEEYDRQQEELGLK